MANESNSEIAAVLGGVVRELVRHEKGFSSPIIPRKARKWGSLDPHIGVRPGVGHDS